MGLGGGRVCIEISGSLNLELSMYASFASSLYRYIYPGLWYKAVGFGRGHVIEALPGKLCCSGEGCSTRLLRLVSGEWCISQCIRGLEEAGYGWLLDLYPGLRVLAVPPEDRLIAAAASVLATWTSYVGNVRSWIGRIFGETALPNGRVLLDKARRIALTIRNPQVQMLAAALPELARVVEEIDGLAPPEARRRLLQVRWVGPKAADLTLLFTGITTMVAPGDRHLRRLISDLWGYDTRPREKVSCLSGSAWCPRCRFRGDCLQGLIVDVFGPGSGLLQTIAYVYGRLGPDAWRAKLRKSLEHYFR
ncbi:MAG: hypothetical protein DSY37_04455 [Hyperthermus sp.]|nr:MAG: hypothetical protein DSY37_04455 [Hyperthermus sp.]